MLTIFEPITKFFTVIFNFFLNLVKGLGVTNEGYQYVLAVTLLTILIRLFFLLMIRQPPRSTQKMQEVQPEILIF